jgi:hypothetical protein
MELFAFTSEEDEYLKDAFRKRIRVSRMAVKLRREYDSVAQRLVDFGYILAKDNDKRVHCKYETQDEIEFDMLMDGSTEEELEKIVGCTKVGLSACSGSNEEED